ncbi:uncharacterized protein LOC135383981 [Ornithodoros turicata]|uniref:uncharacterized protein LOC135383981 n=1 Tax=Ornithodoros turicata TaxID=34597 RepID=UPI0031386A52
MGSRTGSRGKVRSSRQGKNLDSRSKQGAKLDSSCRNHPFDNNPVKHPADQSSADEETEHGNNPTVKNCSKKYPESGAIESEMKWKGKPSDYKSSNAGKLPSDVSKRNAGNGTVAANSRTRDVDCKSPQGIHDQNIPFTENLHGSKITGIGKNGSLMDLPKTDPGESSLRVEVTINKANGDNDKNTQSMGAKSIVLSVEGIMRRLFREKFGSISKSKLDELSGGNTALERMTLKTALVTPKSSKYPESSMFDASGSHRSAKKLGKAEPVAQDVEVSVCYAAIQNETKVEAQTCGASPTAVTTTSHRRPGGTAVSSLNGSAVAKETMAPSICDKAKNFAPAPNVSANQAVHDAKGVSEVQDHVPDTRESVKYKDARKSSKSEKKVKARKTSKDTRNAKNETVERVPDVLRAKRADEVRKVTSQESMKPQAKEITNAVDTGVEPVRAATKQDTRIFTWGTPNKEDVPLRQLSFSTKGVKFRDDPNAAVSTTDGETEGGAPSSVPLPRQGSVVRIARDAITLKEGKEGRVSRKKKRKNKHATAGKTSGSPLTEKQQAQGGQQDNGNRKGKAVDNETGIDQRKGYTSASPNPLPWGLPAPPVVSPVNEKVEDVKSAYSPDNVKASETAKDITTNEYRVNALPDTSPGLSPVGREATPSGEMGPEQLRRDDVAKQISMEGMRPPLKMSEEFLSFASPRTPAERRMLMRSEFEERTGSIPILVCGACILVLLTVAIVLLVVYFVLLNKSTEAQPCPPGQTSTRPSSVSPSTTGASSSSSSGAATSHAIYFCSTAHCNLEGSYIASILNANTKPCDNFYDYVCEVWGQRHPHDSSQTGSVVSTDTLLEAVIAKRSIPMLQNATQNDVRVASKLYEDCTDRSKVGTAVMTAREIFRLWTIGDWPITGTNSTMGIVWRFAGELIRDLDIEGIVGVDVGVDPDALTYTIIELEEPELIFFRGDEARAPLVQLYRDAIMEIASEFGVHNAIQDKLADGVMTVFERMAYSVHNVIMKGTASGPPSATVGELDRGLQALLNVVFGSVYQLSQVTKIVLKSPEFIRFTLPDVLNGLPPSAMLNYLGFLALVHMAPFFSDRLRSLRQVFSESVIGRPSQDVNDTSTLCLRLIDKVLPTCISKAYAQFKDPAGATINSRQWFDQLVDVFGRQVSQLYWIDQLSALIVHYILQQNDLLHFPSNTNLGSCSPNYPTPPSSPLRFYHDISILHQQEKIQNIIRQGGSKQWRLEQSAFNTIATYDYSRHVVYVPQGLINSSVSTGSTLFAFHLARVAVRIYHALVEILLDDNIYVGDVPIRFTHESQRRLSDLMNCLERDLRHFPHSLGPNRLLMDAASIRRSALIQTTAVYLGYRAFRELLHARRIWHLDFRFQTLPTISDDQLFFIYFALDNCESGDDVYHWKKARAYLPAQHQVNLPLRHLPEFASVFSCGVGSAMVIPESAMCEVGPSF